MHGRPDNGSLTSELIACATTTVFWKTAAFAAGTSMLTKGGEPLTSSATLLLMLVPSLSIAVAVMVRVPGDV